MASSGIAYINLADSGVVGASTQALKMPASNVQNPHIATKWRSSTNSDFIVVDLLEQKYVDTVMVNGLTCSEDSIVRVRLSSADPSGASGDLGDTGYIESGTTNFDYNYGAVVFVLDAPVNARYARIDIEDTASDYVEIGRLFVGLKTQFTYNYNWGWGIGYNDRSTKKKSRGGQTLVMYDNSFRTLNIDFGWISSEQRYGIVEQVDRVNGQHTDVLLLSNLDSTNLARDSIWGLISSSTPIVNPALAEIFGKQYQIEERL